MTEPLSVAAGIAGLLSLGIQVTDSLVKFYKKYKDQDADVARITGNLESLLNTFQSLDTTLQSRTFPPGEQNLIKNVESSIQKCDELIQELKDECKKLDKATAIGIKSRIKVAGRRAAYPFRHSTLEKLDEDVSEIRDNLSLALDVLQLKAHQKIQDGITEIQLLLERMRASNLSSEIRDWLKALDATLNHNAACAKRHPGTGAWFIKDSIFTTWLTQDNSFLWLNGFAGCGKSVLCSTAIQHTFRHKRSNQRVGISFFYFTFSDLSKQDDYAMLRALLLQLSGQLPKFQPDLARLRDSYSTGMPPVEVLMQYLENLISRFDQVYILLDGLDESPRHGHRDRVLNAVESMRKWLLPGLHLLVTSRDETDIRESLSPAGNEEIVMKNIGIDEDISSFISGQLKIDQKLRKWSAHHDRIQKALANQAHGVFRWVECQFEALKWCPRSESHLDRCLQSLPQGLDETYERILCSIDKSSIEEARRILTLLCFSARPLTVQELIDGIAVDLHEPAGLNPRRRLQDVDDIRGICPGLIDISIGRDLESEYGDSESECADSESECDGNDLECDDSESTMEDTIVTLRIAHFSVQEYLESYRIRQQKAAIYALERVSVHAEIAQLCLIYLQEPELSKGDLDLTKLAKFPLARFAADFWHRHYKNAIDTTSELDRLVLELFQNQKTLHTWLKLFDSEDSRSRAIENSLEIIGSSLEISEIASPIYYAALLGLTRVLQELIAKCQESASEIEVIVNTRGGYFGSALQAASIYGHSEAVQILLDARADVNLEDKMQGTALQVASVNGHSEVVRLLLDAKADVNAQGSSGSALYAASANGHNKVVRMLIDAKADVNAQGGYFGNALQAASANGHNEVVRMLIDAKADVNAREGSYGSALQAASANGRSQVVRMLIDAKADVNAQGGFHRSALDAALTKGHDTVAEMLIAAGAI